MAKLTEWAAIVPHAGQCPHAMVDYRLAENPYQAKYGGNWRSVIGSTVFMKRYMCVTELVRKMYEASEIAFRGTTHEDTWFFYHDALAQMTAKSTIQWMKDNTNYNRWLIPQLG